MSMEIDMEQLAQAHGRAVWAYLRFLGADRELADEIRQQAFMALFEGKFQHRDAAQTSAWLRTVAQRKYWEEMRRRQGTSLTNDEDQAMDRAWQAQVPGDDLEEALGRLRDCLGRMSARSREALELRYADEVSRGEMARRLGVTESGIAQMLQRAKSTLRECMERNTEGSR